MYNSNDEKYRSSDSINAEKRVVFIVVGVLILLIFLMAKKGDFSSSNYKPVKESYVSKLTYAEELIERNLKNPDSYKRRDFNVNYTENGKVESIIIDYTATNSFGGTVREKYKFIFNDGKLLVEKL